MDKIRVGILGPGGITNRFMAGKAENVIYYSVGARNIEKAKAFKEKYNLEKYYSIDELIADKDVDAIYVATPNHTHYEFVKKCLLAGKSVMCEKPFVASLDECNELYDIAKEKGVMLMEAMKALFLPLTQKVKKMIETKEIGELLYMEGKFSDRRALPEGQLDTTHFTYEPRTGGAMRDTGVYPMAYFDYLAGSKIKSVKSLSRYIDTIDTFSSFVIEYENGCIANCVAGFDVNCDKNCNIYGTKGKIHIDNFWKTGKATFYKYNYGDNGMSIETIDLNEEMISDFKYETEHFADCVLNGLTESPIMSRFQSEELFKAFYSKDIYTK